MSVCKTIKQLSLHGVSSSQSQKFCFCLLIFKDMAYDTNTHTMHMHARQVSLKILQALSSVACPESVYDDTVRETPLSLARNFIQHPASSSWLLENIQDCCLQMMEGKCFSLAARGHENRKLKALPPNASCS